MSTSFIMVTNSLLRKASSLQFFNPLCTRLFVILSALSSTLDKDPYSFNNFTAVLTPTPATPGTLSDESPISANKSIIFSGGRPHLSTTPFLSYMVGEAFLLPGAYKNVFSFINCIKSLSPLTI